MTFLSSLHRLAPIAARHAGPNKAAWAMLAQQQRFNSSSTVEVCAGFPGKSLKRRGKTRERETNPFAVR